MRFRNEFGMTGSKLSLLFSLIKSENSAEINFGGLLK